MSRDIFAQSRRPSFRHIELRSNKMDRCQNCGQDLIEIENAGLRLTGCLTCNLWAAVEGDRWVRLSEEDLPRASSVAS
jgi:hypothetical protein